MSRSFTINRAKWGRHEYWHSPSGYGSDPACALGWCIKALGRDVAMSVAWKQINLVKVNDAWPNGPEREAEIARLFALEKIIVTFDGEYP